MFGLAWGLLMLPPAGLASSCLAKPNRPSTSYLFVQKGRHSPQAARLKFDFFDKNH